MAIENVCVWRGRGSDYVQLHEQVQSSNLGESSNIPQHQHTQDTRHHFFSDTLDGQSQMTTIPQQIRMMHELKSGLLVVVVVVAAAVVVVVGFFFFAFLFFSRVRRFWENVRQFFPGLRVFFFFFSGD